jgi:ABC-type sugar transport system substrate-binding protein
VDVRGRTRIAGLLALAAAAVAALAAAATIAAAPAKTTKTVTIGYAAPGLVGGQRDILRGFQHWAQQKGWKVNVADSQNDAQKQVSEIENFVAAGVDAIVAVPQDSRAICSGVQAAQKAHVPFYTIDRAPIGCKINMSVLSDNFLAGKQSGDAMVSLLKGRYGSAKGKVLEITGDLTQNVAQLRGGGFESVIKKNKGIKLITKQGNWDAAKGQEIARDVLTANPDLDGIYMHSDAVYMPGTLAVLKQVQKLAKRGQKGHVILTGVDGSPAGVQAIRDGWADESSGQPIPDFGIITNYIQKELKGQKITAGTVVKNGALWSPAKIKSTPEGFSLVLSTTYITIKNANNPGLWANQK